MHTIHQLYIVRFLLGLAEAGYFPGIVLYLTYWFRQRERAQAVALFLTGLPVTSIVGAPISGLILDHAHLFGVSSWRWLLILEGLPAIIGGIVTYFVLPNGPAKVTFLYPSKKRNICSADLVREEQEKKLEQHHYSVVQVMLNGRVLYLAFAEFGILIAPYTFQFWAPQLIKSSLQPVFKHRRRNAGHDPTLGRRDCHGPRVVQFGPSIRAEIPCRYSGTLGRIRCLLLIGVFHSLFTLIAFLSLLAVAAYAWTGPFFALPSEFLTGSAAAAGIGLINSIGNLGGFVGPYALGVVSGRRRRKSRRLRDGIPTCPPAWAWWPSEERAASSGSRSHRPNGWKVADQIRTEVKCSLGRDVASYLSVGISFDPGSEIGGSFMATPLISVTSEYALGYTAAEQQRLIRQATRIAPVTERLFREVGIGPGQRVLDLGSGMGDVAMLVARLVGPTGEVVGIEREPSSIARAKGRVAEAGLHNLSFTEMDVTQIASDHPFDAAVGRFILMFLPDPVSVLCSVSRLVRPGGVVAFQEPSWIPMLALGARLPLWSKVLAAIHETFLRSGVNMEMGLHLYVAFQQVGLPAPAMRMETLMGGDIDCAQMPVDVLHSMRPLAQRHNVSLEGLGDLETLADRIYAEATRLNAVMNVIPLVSAWARKAAD